LITIYVIPFTNANCIILLSVVVGEDASFGLPPALSSNLEDLLAEKVDRAKEREEENKLSPKVSVMKPILRFLQLLCENHNRQMQNLLRDQVKNKNSFVHSNHVCHVNIKIPF
jgi:hypothetical protein